MKVKPTVGRVVWFEWRDGVPDKHGFHSSPTGQPHAAQIVHVWSDNMVNLSVLDADGQQHAITSVPLLQEGEDPAGAPFWCRWMPYQTGQAKAHAVDLDAMFTYHPPKEGQASRYGILRDSARGMAETILDYCPESRERLQAIDRLSEVVMLANASIARNE